MSLLHFTRKFAKLHTASKNGDKAPHKPILLLSIIQGFESGEISENRIYITPQLAARFKDNWHTFVTSQSFHPKFYLPFYHMVTEGFWFLKMLPGREIALTSSYSPKSFTSLTQVIEYAYLDDELFLLLMNDKSRITLQQTLIDTYFHGLQIATQYNLLSDIEAQILNEAPAPYTREITEIDDEEKFIRDGVFKTTIPRIYNYTCCISGLRIIATRNVQMVDACHIIPFSETRDQSADNIKNGLSLSPNLHRAFDRFLITIDQDYRVIVSHQFTESGDHTIHQFHGKQILLPSEIKYMPSLENLSWHYSKFRLTNN